MPFHDYEDVDKEALELSIKIIAVLSVVCIALPNLVLTVRLLVQKKLLKSPRRSIVFSLAICNMILALFAVLVGHLMYPFEVIEYNEQTCKLFKMVNIYYHLHTFVSGLGLVTLCVELMLRRWLQSLIKKPCIIGFVFSGFPWFLGIVVILPLFLIGYDFEECTYSGDYSEVRGKITSFIVCFGPACLPVVISIVAVAVQFEPMSDCIERETHHIEEHVPLVPLYSKGEGFMMNPPPEAASDNQPCLAPGYPYVPKTLNPDRIQLGPSLQPSISVNQPHQPEPPPQNLPPTFIPQPVVAPHLSDPATSLRVYPSDTATSQRVLASSRAEKKTLLLMSFLFALCQLPFGIFAYTYLMKEEESLSGEAFWALLLGFSILSQMWSVIIPFIWMVVLFEGDNLPKKLAILIFFFRRQAMQDSV